MSYIPAVDVSHGCIIATGTPDATTGYIRKSRFNKTFYAHRLAYSDANGGIPTGYHIHHLCDNKLCINPGHLVALTPSEHREAHSLPKSAAYYNNLTTCKYGHPFDRHDGRQRVCSECKHRIANAYTLRKRLEKQNVIH